MANQDDSNDKYLKIHFLCLNNLSMTFCVVNKPIIAYVALNVTSFLSWILQMLPWIYVQDKYLTCSRTILESRFHP